MDREGFLDDVEQLIAVSCEQMDATTAIWNRLEPTERATLAALGWLLELRDDPDSSSAADAALRVGLFLCHEAELRARLAMRAAQRATDIADRANALCDRLVKDHAFVGPLRRLAASQAARSRLGRKAPLTRTVERLVHRHGTSCSFAAIKADIARVIALQNGAEGTDDDDALLDIIEDSCERTVRFITIDDGGVIYRSPEGAEGSVSFGRIKNIITAAKKSSL
jgi:hypothetical protein